LSAYNTISFDVASSLMSQAVLTLLIVGRDFFPLKCVHSTKEDPAQWESTYTKNLKNNSELKVIALKTFRNCKIRWPLKTQAMYSSSNCA